MKKYALFLIMGIMFQFAFVSMGKLADSSILDLGVRNKSKARKNISFFDKSLFSRVKRVMLFGGYQFSEIFQSFSTKSFGLSLVYLDECLESFRHNENKRKLTRMTVGEFEYFDDEQLRRDIGRTSYFIDGKELEWFHYEDQDIAKTRNCENFVKKVSLFLIYIVIFY